MFLALGRAGCLGCGPGWHSPAPPKASRASAQRQDARGRGRVRGHILRAAGAPPAGYGAQRVAASARLRAAGARREAGGSGALRRPHRAPRPPPPASRSHFSFSTPGARVSPRSLNDAQVPPGCRPLYFTSLSETRLSLHHDSLSPVPLPRSRGFGVKGLKGLGEGSVTEFPITHSFGLFPEARQLRLPPSTGAPPAPREVAAAGESQSSSRAWVPAS